VLDVSQLKVQFYVNQVFHWMTFCRIANDVYSAMNVHVKYLLLVMDVFCILCGNAKKVHFFRND